MMGSEPPSARDMLFIPWATLSCDSVTTFYGPGHRHTAPAPGDLGRGVEQQAAHTCASPNTHAGTHVYTRTHSRIPHHWPAPGAGRAWAPGGTVEPASAPADLCCQPRCPWSPKSLRRCGSTPTPDRPCTPRTLSRAHPHCLLPASQNCWFSGPPLQPCLPPPPRHAHRGSRASEAVLFPAELASCSAPFSGRERHPAGAQSRRVNGEGDTGIGSTGGLQRSPP